MLRLASLFAIIPMTLLLAVSFFVLFFIRKSETLALKAFGYVIAAMLWIGALLIFSAGVYAFSIGRRPSMGMMMQKMMCGQVQEMMGGGSAAGMARGHMPVMMHGGKESK